jgi:hypothetical protein
MKHKMCFQLTNELERHERIKTVKPPMSSNKISFLAKYFLVILTMMHGPAYAARTSFNPETMTMEFQGEKLSAMIKAVPLKQVIKEFSESTGVEVVWQGRETERMVQVRFAGLSVDDAARRLLRNENYVLYYSAGPGKEKLEKIVIVPRGERAEDQEFIPPSAPEKRMLTMVEEPESEIPAWNEVEAADYDQYELIEALEEHLLLQGDTETADALMQDLQSETNPY